MWQLGRSLKPVPFDNFVLQSVVYKPIDRSHVFWPSECDSQSCSCLALVLLALDELPLLAAGIIPLVFIWFVLGLRLGKEYDHRVDGAQLAPQ